MVKEVPLYIEIREILNKYDPIDLKAKGCPEDEYDPEAKIIARRLRRISNPKQLADLADIVHGVFVNMFNEGLAGSKQNYQQLASDLFKLRASL